MSEWRTFIDPSVGAGQTTIDGIIADGSTFGVGISSNLSVSGITTFADNVNVNSDIYVQGDLRLDGKIKDGDNNFGSSGQVLSSDGTDTRWVNAGTLSAGAASQVAINDDSNTDASRFLTFVDSSSGNNSIKTDPQLTYNPSTNVISTAGVDLSDNSRIRFGANNDLRISHTNDLSGQNDSNGDSVLDGNNYCSYIHENGAGPLIFKSNGGPSTGAYHFYDTGWRPILKLFSGTGARAALYYAGSEKLITSSSGVTITGTATATAFSGPLTGNVTGNISGNAGTATILANTRTIGGVSFNGSANINLPGVNQAGNQNTSGNAATATVLETTRNFSIGGEITANAVNFNGSGNVILSATVDDNIIDEANLKISNSGTNGQFLQKQSGNDGGLTWADVTVPAANTLSGTTLASGITASSITSLGTLTGLSVDGNVSVDGNISVTTGSITGNGSGLTNLDASDLASGTIPDARFPSTLPTISGANLTNLDASDLSSGTVPAARLPNHSASLLTSGTIPDARISGNFLRSDQSDTFTGNLTVNGVIYLQDQIRIGDDVFIEDCNVANTFRVKGNSSHADGDANKGFIAFGSQTKKLGCDGASADLTYDGQKVWTAGTDGASSGLDADLLDGQHGSYYSNYNNLNNKPTIPTQTSQLTNNSGFITGTDVRSANEATSTGQSETSSSVYQDKVTLSVSTASNSRVLVVYGFELESNGNGVSWGLVTGSNTSFVGGNIEETKSGTWQKFSGTILDIGSHSGTRTYKIRFRGTGNGWARIKNAYLVAIEMQV